MTTNRVPIFLAFVNKYKGKNKPEIWHIDEASKKMPIINPGSCKKHILGEKWYMRRASLTLNNLVFVLYYKYSHFATGILFILIVPILTRTILVNISEDILVVGQPIILSKERMPELHIFILLKA